MFSFENDYSEGACESVLKALVAVNNEQNTGYGLDKYSIKAGEMIKNLVGNENAAVHFITGGTPCNVTVISLLKSYEAVICVKSGHINVHETGGPEATGHKIIAVEGKDGKILPEEIEEIVLTHPDEHTVKPKMVFISDSTEVGTIYTKAELEAISEVCKKYNLYLYLDGARLGAALMASGNDLTLKDIAALTDIFYIGGTKNGLLLSEAVVILNDDLKENFRYSIKQHCSMLAKGWISGVQFLAVFKDNIYFKNAKNADVMAQALANVFRHFDIPLYIDSPTNQIFPILENSVLEKIQEKYVVSVWGKYDETHTITRFCCSWATKKENIEDFYRDLRTITRG
ncbi:MAG: aminotransferase class I/II-fold pyridoxal phosphate-dependent enzyme [Erysipelotrichaceae bacterium]|nr:aminotransferase class I/II-fold pyridoxal phosphate-dependent enzyme [Erysipelotrichaceae bacterium]